jgi:hypothetical protein
MEDRMNVDYKALTHINLPFLEGDEGRFAPGDMIPLSTFEESAANLAAVVDDRTDRDPNATGHLSAQEVIDDLIKYGSLSDDPDAPLHPDSIIPEPGALSLNSLVAQAQILVEQLTESGQEVPDQLKALAESNNVSISEAATGSDKNA